MQEWKEIEEAPNYLISEQGEVINTASNKALKAHIHSGHLSVRLLIDGKYVFRRVDQLVARIFYGTTIPEKPRGRKKEQIWRIDRETGEHIPIN